MIMPNALVLRGFDELMAELAALPEELKREATPIEAKHARVAMSEVVAAYPDVTGDLRAGVRIVERPARGIAVLITLITSTWYAHIYEFGSVHQRPRATFLPITERIRRESTAEVVGMVEDHGLVVRGKLT